MQIYLILALILSGIAILFALQNTAPVTVSFVVWRFDSFLALVIIIALAAGALISMLLSLPSLIRHKWNLNTQSKKIGSLESNLTDYRARLEEAQKKLAELQGVPLESLTKPPADVSLPSLEDINHSKFL